MTVIIVPTVAHMSWAEEYFPGRSLLSLPVASKTWLEHLLDYCCEQGAQAVRILDWNFDAGLTQAGDMCGERWALRLAYSGSAIPTSPEQARARCRAFIGDDADVRVLWGALFPYGDGLVPVRSLREWYELSMRLLHDSGGRVLPGYTTEPHVFVGENVSIKTRADVKPPVLLDDGALIENGTTLAGDVIVGRGAYVDAGSRLERSIVFGGTYVGRSLLLTGKVVDGCRVIDPLSGAMVEVSDGGMVSVIRRFSNLRRRMRDLVGRLVDPGLRTFDAEGSR